MKKSTFALLSALLFSTTVSAAEWGTISGSIILDDEIPEPVLRFAKGATVDPAGNPIKDAEVCAANDVYSEDLLINADTKGVSNVFVYLYKAPKDIHADSTKVPATVIFDQKNCIFKPHTLVLQAGQGVEVLNSDPVAHNTHTIPLKNQPQNVIVAPNTPAGMGVNIPTATREILPHKVQCDFHPWMTAYWLVLDHPYAAATDAKGNFTIKNLPVGDHEFRIWHERPGYVERKYKVTVKAGSNELEPFKVKLSTLEDK